MRPQQALLGVKLTGTLPKSGRCSFSRPFDFNFQIMSGMGFTSFLVAGSERLGSGRLGGPIPVIVDGMDTLEIHGAPGARWQLVITVMLTSDVRGFGVPAPKAHEEVIECDQYTKEI